MILVIDNYDSFTYNLVQMVAMLGAETLVRRNDRLDLQAVEKLGPEGILISPGPGSPCQAGISVDLFRHFGGRIPMLGICLGHQCLAYAFGAVIRQARSVMHGKLSTITHRAEGLFSGLPQAFQAVRYHSLAIDRQTLPGSLEACAEAEDGEVMAIAHTQLPLFGIQFHPESIATQHGSEIVRQFLEHTRPGRQGLGRAG